jgi:hypothetical protein
VGRLHRDRRRAAQQGRRARGEGRLGERDRRLHPPGRCRRQPAAQLDPVRDRHPRRARDRRAERAVRPGRNPGAGARDPVPPVHRPQAGLDQAQPAGDLGADEAAADAELVHRPAAHRRVHARLDLGRVLHAAVRRQGWHLGPGLGRRGRPGTDPPADPGPVGHRRDGHGQGCRADRAARGHPGLRRHHRRLRRVGQRRGQGTRRHHADVRHHAGHLRRADRVGAQRRAVEHAGCLPWHPLPARGGGDLRGAHQVGPRSPLRWVVVRAAHSAGGRDAARVGRPGRAALLRGRADPAVRRRRPRRDRRAHPQPHPGPRLPGDAGGDRLQRPLDAGRPARGRGRGQPASPRSCRPSGSGPATATR